MCLCILELSFYEWWMAFWLTLATDSTCLNDQNEQDMNEIKCEELEVNTKHDVHGDCEKGNS